MCRQIFLCKTLIRTPHARVYVTSHITRHVEPWHVSSDINHRIYFCFIIIRTTCHRLPRSIILFNVFSICLKIFLPVIFQFISSLVYHFLLDSPLSIIVPIIVCLYYLSFKYNKKENFHFLSISVSIINYCGWRTNSKVRSVFNTPSPVYLQN